MPPGPALEIVGEVAGALHVAYTSEGPGGTQLKLLHRDIKPANIRITPAGEVKILDFGIARADFGSREAKTQNLAFGSSPYMSPERLDFIDTRGGDIYSLGCVLFEMLTGQRHGRTSSKKDRHLALLLKNLSVLRKSLGEGHDQLVDLVASLLTYEPTDRPLARDVERQCTNLRAHYPTMALRDWSETAVTEILQSTDSPESGPLEGANLVLESGKDGEIPTLATAINTKNGGRKQPNRSIVKSNSDDATTPAPVAFRLEDPAQPSTASWKGWILAGVLVALLFAAGRSIRGTRDLGQSAGDAEVGQIEKSDAPDAPELIDNTAEPAEAPQAVTPRSRPVRRTVTPPPKAPAALAMGKVELRGSGAQKLILSRNGTTVEAPASLPVGTWSVSAHFPDGIVPVGSFSILEGRTTTISCNAAFQTCRKD